jgi:hypothetical protein
MSYLGVLILSLGIGLPSAIILMIEFGRRAGVRWLAKNPTDDRKGLERVEAAIYGLMGLLIAFTFFGAAERFDHRRELIVRETNHIGTAYWRLDLLPPASQPMLKDAMRRYLDSRLAVYRSFSDPQAIRARMAESVEIEAEIWKSAVAAVGSAGTNANAVTTLVLSSLNEMMDIATVQTMARESHPPRVIYAMLIAMVLAGSLFAGFEMAASNHQSWFHIIAFALLLSIAIFVILDLEYPRVGAIRIDDFDQALIDLRQRME